MSSSPKVNVYSYRELFLIIVISIYTFTVPYSYNIQGYISKYAKNYQINGKNV